MTDPKQAQLEAILKEGHALTADERFIKSEASKEMMILLLRFMEVATHGGPVTQHRPRHHPYGSLMAAHRFTPEMTARLRDMAGRFPAPAIGRAGQDVPAADHCA